MLRSLLKHPAAPVRMEAALSLGKIGATDAMPDLKAMMSDPEVRSYAAVALARLGDPDGEAVVQELLQSPVLDMRLLGAQAYEGKGTGPWVQALMPALQDPDGLTRIRAAEMLAAGRSRGRAPGAARSLEGPQSGRPCRRHACFRADGAARRQSAGARTRRRKAEGPTALDALRRLLRDPEPASRLHAAGAILAMVKGAR